MSQNVRFIKTTKQKHLERESYDDNAIYFCQDTKEIYKGQHPYTEGVVIVPTKADLPSCPCAADGVVYFIEETKSGFMMSPDRTHWLQTIYAPVTDAYTIPEEEMYTTVTTVGAVRDIEKKINERIDNIDEECITSNELTLAFESVGIVSLARDDDNVIYTDKNGKPYAIRQSNLSDIVKTINNEKPDKHGNINVSEFTTEKFAEALEAFGEIALVRDDDETFFTDKDGNILLFDYPSSAATSESGYFLGKTEDGEIIRIPQKTVGTVRTVNGLEPDEDGNIEVCKPLADVGQYIDVEGEIYSIEITKNTALGGRSFEITQEGDTYRVWFNGKSYECVSRKKVEDDYTCYVVGNDNISNSGGPDTGEPFYYSFKKSNYETKSDYGIIRVKEHGTHTFSIAKLTKTAVKVPEEFLPEDKYCKALADVGNYVEVDGDTFTTWFSKNTAFRDRYMTITEAGKLYKVVFNGELYLCKSRRNIVDNYEAFILGNDDISNDGGTDTGEPFYYCFKKYYDSYNSDYALIRVRERGSYSISITEVSKELIKIPGELLPEINVGVKTINCQAPDENGNVELDISGNIKTINNEIPDEDGNINIDIGVKTVNSQVPDENGNVAMKIPIGVKTINNIYPDVNQNIEICPELADVGENVFWHDKPTYAYYKELGIDNGAELCDPADYWSNSKTMRFKVDGKEFVCRPTDRQYIYSQQYNSTTDTFIDYCGFGNFNILGLDIAGSDGEIYQYGEMPFVYYNYKVYKSRYNIIESGVCVKFEDGEEHSYSVEIGGYYTKKIPENLLPDPIPPEQIRNHYSGIKTINNIYPDANENIDICPELMNVGHRFVHHYPRYSYYYKYEWDARTNGVAIVDPRQIKDDEIIRITFGGQVYEYRGSDRREYIIGSESDCYGCFGYGNFRILGSEEPNENPIPDTEEPFVYYFEDRWDGIEVLPRIKTSPELSYSIEIGHYEFSTIPQELLPDPKPTVIIIECPEFNGQKSILCETLGGYAIAEMQDFINNGGIVKIKRTGGWTGVSSIDTYYYEATSFVPVVNHDQSAIVFTASTVVPSGIIVTDEYSDNGDLEVRCSDAFATDPSHQILVWAYNTLIDGYNGDSDNSIIEVDSWAAVQQIVRSGKASEVFNVGDQLVCKRNGEQLVWDIIGIDHDTPVDETKTHSLTLQLHNCFNDMTFSFDAAEPTNPDTDRALKGSNNWIESNIRQWLNSNKSANNWFEPQTEYDTAPHYANIDGFLYGMDVDFVSVLGEVSKTTQLSDDIDGGIVDSIEKVFLLSMTEVYCGGTEGVAYEYYVSASSVGQPNQGADDARIKHYSNGAAADWWLRSANQYTSGKIRPVGASGNITWTDAYLNRLGVIPACCII